MALQGWLAPVRQGLLAHLWDAWEGANSPDWPRKKALRGQGFGRGQRLGAGAVRNQGYRRTSDSATQAGLLTPSSSIVVS